jgi:hypothetical protein
MPIGGLPIGDVMLSQKVALETNESEVRAVAKSSFPTAFISGKRDHSADLRTKSSRRTSQTPMLSLWVSISALLLVPWFCATQLKGRGTEYPQPDERRPFTIGGSLRL